MEQVLGGLKWEIPTKWVDAGPRDRLLDMDIEDSVLSYYLSIKTKASFQGSGDLQNRIVLVLGLPETTRGQPAMDGLDRFFKARNEIVHEMDFTGSRDNSIARRARSANDVQEQCYSALNTAAESINTTIATLSEAKV